MTLAEIEPIHDNSLYDRDGNLVGKWYGERGMLADCFVVRERVCHLLPTPDGGYSCDKCYTWFSWMKKRTNYCPNCGAKVMIDDD